MPSVFVGTGFRWDAVRNRYRDEGGRLVSRAQVRQALDEAIDSAKGRIQEDSDRLRDGEIDLAGWQMRMRRHLKSIHVMSGAAAVGGWDQAKAVDWSIVANRLKREYQFLDRFARDIEAERVSLDAVSARAAMYGNAGSGTYEKVLRRKDMRLLRVKRERRLLHSGDPCHSCVTYAEMGWQEPGILPDIGEDCECHSNCRCTFDRETESLPKEKKEVKKVGGKETEGRRIKEESERREREAEKAKREAEEKAELERQKVIEERREAEEKAERKRQELVKEEKRRREEIERKRKEVEEERKRIEEERKEFERKQKELEAENRRKREERQAQEAKRRQEEAEKRKAAEEAERKRKAAEEEAKREELRRKEAEKAKKREEAKRKKEEKKAEEAEKLRKEKEEADRKFAERQKRAAEQAKAVGAIALPEPKLIPPGKIEDRLKAYTLGDKKVEIIASQGARLAELETEFASSKERFMELLLDSSRRNLTPEERKELNELTRKRTGLESAINAERDALSKVVTKVLAAKSPMELPVSYEGGVEKNGGKRLDPVGVGERKAIDGGVAWLSNIVDGSQYGKFAVTKFGVQPPDQEQRGYCGDDGFFIAISQGDNIKTVIHEMGHSLEYRLKTSDGRPLYERSKEFLRYRLGDEPLKKMRDVTGDQGYRENEMGRKDQFDRAFPGASAYYVGKEYVDATEVIAMGIEKIYRDPGTFARNDPEYFKYVIGVLDGSLR